MSSSNIINKHPKVILSPSVIFSILDYHIRRGTDRDRAFGTLLGYYSDDVYEIRNCFAVPAREVDGVFVFPKDYAEQMEQMHLKVNPKEQVIGWFTTGNSAQHLSIQSCSIHEYYEKRFPSSLILVVDTTLTSDKLNIKSYISRPLLLNQKSLGVQFHQLEISFSQDLSEVLAVDAMIRDDEKSETMVAKEEIMNIREVLQISIEKIKKLLDECLTYVKKVNNHEIQGDEEIGREIIDALNAIPRINLDEFKTSYKNSIQDLLMVVYLSNLTKTQLMVAEKLAFITS